MILSRAEYLSSVRLHHRPWRGRRRRRRLVAVVVSSASTVVSSSPTRRPTRRPLRHHPDPRLSVAGETAFVVASSVALSFTMVSGTALVTRSPAHCRALFSFAPAAAVHVLVVVVTLVVAASFASGVPSTAVGTAAVVGPAVETTRAVLSTAAATERLTCTAR